MTEPGREQRGWKDRWREWRATVPDEQFERWAPLAALSGVLVVALVLVGLLHSGPSAPTTATRPPAPRPPRGDVTTPTATIPTAPTPAPPPPPPPPDYAVRSVPAPERVDVRFANPPRGFLLFNVGNGLVLQRHSAFTARPIASLTKMMTSLIAVQRVTPQQPVRISRRAVTAGGSAVGVLPLGRTVPFETLLYGLMLPSGNDAAIAIAEQVSGSVPAFVQLMNSEVGRLRLRCSHFSTPNGLINENNFSCPVDLALLARDIVGNARLEKVVSTSQVALPFAAPGGRLVLRNTNPLLRLGYPGVTGVKTGFTSAAGRCFVATARRGNTQLGVVLLNSPDTRGQSEALLNAGFAQIRRARIARHNAGQA